MDRSRESRSRLGVRTSADRSAIGLFTTGPTGHRSEISFEHMNLRIRCIVLEKGGLLRVSNTPLPEDAKAFMRCSLIDDAGARFFDNCSTRKDADTTSICALGRSREPLTVFGRGFFRDFESALDADHHLDVPRQLAGLFNDFTYEMSDDHTALAFDTVTLASELLVAFDPDFVSPNSVWTRLPDDEISRATQWTSMNAARAGVAGFTRAYGRFHRGVDA